MTDPTERLEPIKLLLGKTLVSIEGKVGDEVLRFVAEDGETFTMYHSQDCCESVNVEDIIGDLSDLIGSPIVRAEENSSSDPPEGHKYEYQPESCTWTFYRVGTAKGTVVIRWLGTSNGYYSESVTFSKDGE